MNTQGRHNLPLSVLSGLAASLLTAVPAFAQEVVAMAPPVTVPSASAAAASSVFNWQEVPQGQQVILTRASFDSAGYQLYDTQGETIIVPFTDQNLYVMKFGRSTSSRMYFVNDGGVPTLYVPSNGYLENATSSGGHWYPFPQSFQPAQPVYLGIAPSWSDYTSMGWYPGMAWYGGYYSSSPFYSGAAFIPSAGLFVQIGGGSYYGWPAYRSYYGAHPHYYPLSIYRPSYYRWASAPRTTPRFFGIGGNQIYSARPYYQGSYHSSNRPFGIGGSTSYTSNRPFGGGTYNRPSTQTNHVYVNQHVTQIFRGGTTTNNVQPSRPTSSGYRPSGAVFGNPSFRGNNVGGSPFRGNSAPSFRGNSFRGNSAPSFRGNSAPSAPRPFNVGQGGGRRGH